MTMRSEMPLGLHPVVPPEGWWNGALFRASYEVRAGWREQLWMIW